jgi:hypothetical protein
MLLVLVFSEKIHLDDFLQLVVQDQHKNLCPQELCVDLSCRVLKKAFPLVFDYFPSDQEFLCTRY